ncbi:FAD-dependent oxidoreductase, partial [Mesorhizobium sp. M0902]|uniref:FAD-dependent oxidoreductase n=1 Tax=Mesorhizobium sp. M0902 TaxID=2957021 RepID=UPI00333D59BE
MGSITRAMADCARGHGVDILVNADVASIETRNGRVHSVVIRSGDEYVAKTIVANLNAKLLVGKLVSPEVLPSEFVADISRFKTNGATLPRSNATWRSGSPNGRPNTRSWSTGWKITSR